MRLNSNLYTIANRRGNGTNRRADRLGRLGKHWYQSDRLFRNRDQRNLQHRSWEVNKDNTDAFSETWEEFEASENPETQHKTDRVKKEKGRSSGALWYHRRNDILKKLKQLNLKNQDFAVSKTRSYLTADRKMRKARCYICFKRGHIYLDCPNKNRWNYFKRMNRLKGKVNQKSNANEMNNLFFENKIIPEPNWLVLGSDQRGWDEFWYVSSQYPRHMTPSIEQFENFKAKTIGTSKSGEQGLKIKGYGEVNVATEERNFVIPGVYFVPNVGFNTLSLNQLVAQGFKIKIKIKERTCVLMREFDEDPEESKEVSDENIDDTQKGTSEDSDDSSLNEDDKKEILEHAKERAMRAVMRYFESLYDNKGKGKEGEHVPSKNDFDSFVGFMDMINEQEIVEGCKELVRNHFERLVEWFYKVFVHTKKRSVPVKIEDTEVCLLDLYLIVKGMQGYGYVNLERKWKDVATGLGFSEKNAKHLRRCYETHLGLLEAYYNVAKEYSMEELALTLEACGRRVDMGSTESDSKEEETPQATAGLCVGKDLAEFLPTQEEVLDCMETYEGKHGEDSNKMHVETPDSKENDELADTASSKLI